MLSNHGRQEMFLHAFEGVDSRLDGPQAAVLRVKLRHADRYLSRLDGLDLVLPAVDPACEAVWHPFVVRSADRDRLAASLRGDGIDTDVHYPAPLHLQPAYGRLGMGPGASGHMT